VPLVLIIISLILSFTGTKNADYNYVKLEINPAIEFLCLSNGKVATVCPLNAEAKMVVSNETFVGMGVDNAAEKFVDLCVKTGYIDVDRQDNAIKLTAATKMGEVLDVKIRKNLNKYLLKHQIKAVVIENEQDLQEFKRAKKFGVSANKYSLMESVCNLSDGYKMDGIKNLTKKELINVIKTEHDNYCLQDEANSGVELENKTKLIEENRAKLDNHKQKIKRQNKHKYADEYKEFIKSKQKYYKQNFDKHRENWKQNRNNYVVA
jgi:hypothetical protein